MKLEKILSSIDNRYPTAEELNPFKEYATSMPARFTCMKAVERLEKTCVTAAIDHIKKTFPDFDRHHDFAWGKCFRDIQLTLRVGVQAMLLDDVAYLDEKVLFWLRTILASFDFTPGLHSECYGALRDAYRTHLDETSYALMEPHLKRMVEVLADIPEPTVPRV